MGENSKSKDYSEEIKNLDIIPKNFILFSIFIVLCSILISFRYPLLFGDDPWLHSSIAKQLLQISSYDAASEYHDLHGLSFFGSSFSYFSKIEAVSIAQLMPIIFIYWASLVSISLNYYFFKKKQLSIIGAVIFILNPLDFNLTVAQFWPTGLTVLNALSNFIIFSKLKEDKKNPLLILLFYTSGVSCFFIHDFTALLLFGIYCIIFFILSFREKEKIQDFFLYLSLIIFALFFRVASKNSIISSEILDNFSIRFELLILLFILGSIALAIFSKLIIKVIPKPLNTDDSDKLPWMQKGSNELIQDKWFKLKIIRRVSYVAVLLSILTYLLLEDYLRVTHIPLLIMSLTVFCSTFMVVFCVMGALAIQIKNRKAEIIFLWCVIIALLVVGLLLLEVLFGLYQFWVRILIIGSGILSFGCTGYIEIQLTRTKFPVNRNKIGKTIFLLFIVLFTVNYGLYNASNTWNKSDAEIKFAQNYTDCIPNEDGVIITGFRWHYITQYYSDFGLNVEIYRADLIFPENQRYENNTHKINIVMQDFDKNNSYILLDQEQVNMGIMGIQEENYGTINSTIIEEYHQIPYFNKILSMKNKRDNKFNYLYWFIH